MGCVEAKMKKLDDGLDGSAKVYVNNAIRPVCVLRMEIKDDYNKGHSVDNKSSCENAKMRVKSDTTKVAVQPLTCGLNGKALKFDMNVTGKYRFINKLGTGRYSCVWLVESRLTKKPYAMKMTSGLEGKEIFNTELAILSRVRHPNVVQLIETFEREDRYYMVMELASGGDLFDRTESQACGHFMEADAARITFMIADGLRYLHSLFVTHRDLKMDNLLFYHPGPDSKILITDFSVAHSRKSSASKFMSTACGTPEYIGPEILRHQQYTSAVDLWSLGVIVFCILSGSFPFKSDENNPENNIHLYLNIIKGNYSFTNEVWKEVSDAGIDFIKKLLNANPDERMTAAEALRHPWLVKYGGSPNSSLSSSDEISDASSPKIIRKGRHKHDRDPELTKLKQCIIDHRNSRF